MVRQCTSRCKGERPQGSNTGLTVTQTPCRHGRCTLHHPRFALFHGESCCADADVANADPSMTAPGASARAPDVVTTVTELVMANGWSNSTKIAEALSKAAGRHVALDTP